MHEINNVYSREYRSDPEYFISYRGCTVEKMINYC